MRYFLLNIPLYAASFFIKLQYSKHSYEADMSLLYLEIKGTA